MAEQLAKEKERQAPAPDDDRKPDELSDISKPSWKYVLGKTLREFSRDQCTDQAAALTYFAVLAIFPALLALVSLLGLVSDPKQTADALLNLLGTFVSPDVVTAIRPTVEDLTNAPAAGLALVTGILGALWSASGYVGAFARASNRIYEVEEGRGFLQLRPVQFGVTVIVVVLLAVAAGILVLSGPVAQAIGAAIGLGPQVLLIWDIVKWPIVIAIAIFDLALLYYAAPNVKQPKFKWVSVGSIVALVIWALATVGFSFYVTNFGNYEKTYGSLGGVIAFLLWIWISNNALLFGVELDSELERGRQLQGGIPAEENLQLPPRGTKKSEKMADQRAADILHGYQLRKAHEGTDYSDENNGHGDRDGSGDKGGRRENNDAKGRTAGSTAVDADRADRKNGNARNGSTDDPGNRNRNSRERSMTDQQGRKKRKGILGLLGLKESDPVPPSHGARDAWRDEKMAHADDPPVLPDGTRPAPADHTVDQAAINRDTRFAPHKSAGERVE